MRALCLIIMLLCAAVSSAGQTLGDLLRDVGIPTTSFTKAELAEDINGSRGAKGQYVYAVYLQVKGELLTGYPHLLRYDIKTGAILRSELKLDERDECCGSPDGIEFATDFVILSFHYNPSASAVAVLDDELRLVELMYGFDHYEIAPDQIVLTEGLMHFAPVHPERLQFVDLRTGEAVELYPPKGDPLRKRFAEEHKVHMPKRKICREMNDPCDPDLYDEGFTFLGADGKGSFALVAGRDASHAIQKDEPPVSFISESALYLYQRRNGGWFYCAAQIAESEASALTRVGENGYGSVKARCTPNLLVTPDMSTSDFSPFPAPSRRVK